mmetsp:Transcript_118210/g.280640  ORF Transcript_118210/g.280640 Transcript_118210/m.280640 type:complete len:206 (+) Transcript_118210:262-879(+)
MVVVQVRAKPLLKEVSGIHGADNLPSVHALVYSGKDGSHGCISIPAQFAVGAVDNDNLQYEKAGSSNHDRQHQIDQDHNLDEKHQRCGRQLPCIIDPFWYLFVHNGDIVRESGHDPARRSGIKEVDWGMEQVVQALTVQMTRASHAALTEAVRCQAHQNDKHCRCNPVDRNVQVVIRHLALSPVSFSCLHPERKPVVDKAQGAVG